MAVYDEIERLEVRLEVYDASGEIRLSEDCDGIACRDETIRILDEQRDKLLAKVRKYEKWFSDHATVLATHGIGGFEFETTGDSDGA
jgi:hypothetical protein